MIDGIWPDRPADANPSEADQGSPRLPAPVPRALPQTGGAGVVIPSSASAASISSRLMPRRYMTASM